MNLTEKQILAFFRTGKITWPVKEEEDKTHKATLADPWAIRRARNVNAYKGGATTVTRILKKVKR